MFDDFDNSFFDEITEMDFNFDMTIKQHYGPDTEHISNFENYKLKEVKSIVVNLPHTFMHVAYARDGSQITEGMFGVYTTDVSEISTFWDMYERKVNNEI